MVGLRGWIRASYHQSILLAATSTLMEHSPRGSYRSRTLHESSLYTAHFQEKDVPPTYPPFYCRRMQTSDASRSRMVFYIRGSWAQLHLHSGVSAFSTTADVLTEDWSQPLTEVSNAADVGQHSIHDNDTQSGDTETEKYTWMTEAAEGTYCSCYGTSSRPDPEGMQSVSSSNKSERMEGFLSGCDERKIDSDYILLFQSSTRGTREALGCSVVDGYVSVVPAARNTTDFLFHLTS